MPGSPSDLLAYSAGDLNDFPYSSPYTLFHELRTAEFSPLIELDPSNGLSTAYRDTITTANSGSVTNANGEHQAASGTTTGSTAELRTKERGRYQPGIEALAGIATRRPTAPTGDALIYWEYGDDTDAIRIAEDASGVYLRVKRHGSWGDPVYQANWNGDPLDGTGASGLTLDLAWYTIWRIHYAHYGVGPEEIEAFLIDQYGFPRLVLIHTFANSDGAISFSNPKLPIRAGVDNGTTTQDLSLYIGGRHFAVNGRYEPNRRQTTDEALAVSIDDTSYTPLLSFRKKSDRTNTAKSVKVSGVGTLSDTNAVVRMILGGTLTGSSFGSVDGISDSETAVEADVSATAVSGGEVIDRVLVAGGSGNRSVSAGIRRLGLDIPDDTVVTLAVKAVSGTGTANALLSFEEEW